MIEINGKKYCENCFAEATGAVCKVCGFNSEDNAPDPAMLAPGSVLLNRYVIGRVIGKGGFGITYLAYDALVGRKIAVKEYFPYGLAQRTAGSIEVSVTSDDNAEPFKLGAEKFYNEARLVTRFNGNPNIVGVYDCFYENGTVYIAMEYLRGQTLKEYIRDNGILKAPQALFIAKNICSALVVAHSASVLHRDISPDNIMVCDDGGIKLIDFGAARQVVAEHSQSFSVIIKPGFAPPEQYRKKGNQGPWTDVYSLGTTLYFTLTGDIPEDPSSRFDDDDTFKENRFDIDPIMWEIITKATKLTVDERYADAYELKKELDLISIKPEPLVVPEKTADENTEAPLSPVGGIAKMGVSIKPARPKQSFLRRHLRTIIEAACVLAFAAVLIPLAIKAYKPVPVIGGTSEPNGISDTGSGISEPGDTVIGLGGNTPDLRKENYDRPLFSVLDDNEKGLYSYIYYGLLKSEKEIPVISTTYTVAQVQEVYNCVLNDNAHFSHAPTYNISYTDSNINRKPDPDEYITSVIPVYNGIDPNETSKYVEQHIQETRNAIGYYDPNSGVYYDTMNLFRVLYNEILEETTLLARGGRPTASTTHGAVIDHAADDIGIARAVCDYARRLGFYCFVVDINRSDVDMAIVRVKIDDTWYNIAPRFDFVQPSEMITAIPVAEDGKASNIFFLVCDEMMFYGSDTLDRFDDKYLPILPLNLDTHDETLVPVAFSYYFAEYLKTDYLDDTIEATYDALLEKTKTALDSGGETVVLYMSPYNVDALWEMMNESYISDISEKYGITITGFSGEFSLDAMYVTLEK